MMTADIFGVTYFENHNQVNNLYLNLLTKTIQQINHHQHKYISMSTDLDQVLLEI